MYITNLRLLLLAIETVLVVSFTLSILLFYIFFIYLTSLKLIWGIQNSGAGTEAVGWFVAACVMGLVFGWKCCAVACRFVCNFFFLYKNRNNHPSDLYREL